MEASAAEYVPAKQFVHELAPVCAEKRPAAQLTQAVEDVLSAAASETVPKGQAVQLGAPDDSWKVPAAHPVQLLAEAAE